MKDQHKHSLALIVFCLLGFIGGIFMQKQFHSPCQTIDETTVTTVTRDTIKKPVPVSISSKVIRSDKVKADLKQTFNDGALGHSELENEKLVITIDSAGIVSIPITERTYKTDDYEATVQGYLPELKNITLYPKVITNTTTITKYKPPRWAVTVGPGCSYDGKNVTPGITASIGFVIWSK